MAGPIEIFFDFASPYAYFGIGRLGSLAERHGRKASLHPILLWAVRKSLGMASPMDDAAKFDYLKRDMERSSRFYDLPYRMPDAFPISTHLAARIFYALEATDPLKSGPFVRSVFDAYFNANQDISDAAVLTRIGEKYGLGRKQLRAMMNNDGARAALTSANENAAARGVWGSPYVFVDGEAFFGIDRLPQIEWHLAGANGTVSQEHRP
ncbi:2-hydroxychromene-2-carboxylate isomerase [Nitratireductor sp. XY-223]|uniref:2-hydroxychromene-2-carboxylate isomerase n=1 Tax=Nitratireductor sp. XY-223 TaxID=2561926 RepID=UPI0010AAE555|nr:2-hydroxychromene-2-carboxylate isomerase [Nitratireductor sp. XY-223]